MEETLITKYILYWGWGRVEKGSHHVNQAGLELKVTPPASTA